MFLRLFLLHSMDSHKHTYVPLYKQWERFI
jgi:hypothetical protein